MNIMLVLEKWGFEGGREHHNVSMVRAFIERGHKCSIVYGTETDKPVSTREVFNISKHCDPALPVIRHVNDEIYLSEFLRYAEAENPDAVYLGHIRNLITLKEIKKKWPTVIMLQDLWIICLRVCKTYFLRRKPCDTKLGVGCLLHGCFIGKPKKTKKLLRYNSLNSLRSINNIYKSFGSLVVASSFVRQCLIENGFDGNKIHVLGYFDEDFPSTTDPLPEFGNVLFLGRIDRYKGLDVLVEAVKKSKSNARLIIVGDGPFLPKIKESVRALKMENRVDFMGWVPHHELANLFTAATVVAVPSVWAEPFGKVGIEAMAHARPVVAFDVGGISDWLEHGKTGYLVPWKDTNAMAAAIDKVYQNIELSKQMGKLGREIVLKKFSREGYLHRWESLLLETISKFMKQHSDSAFKDI